MIGQMYDIKQAILQWRESKPGLRDKLQIEIARETFNNEVLSF